MPFSRILQDEKDREGWAAKHGSELDESIGFKIVPVSRDDAIEFAMLTVLGKSWEGIRLSVENVFSNKADAWAYAGTTGVLC